MIKHLTPRPKEEVEKALKKMRKPWCQEIKRVVKTLLNADKDFKKYANISFLKYTISKEKLEIGFKNKEKQIIMVNENIAHWINDIYEEYQSTFSYQVINAKENV